MCGPSASPEQTPDQDTEQQGADDALGRMAGNGFFGAIEEVRYLGRQITEAITQLTLLRAL